MYLWENATWYWGSRLDSVDDNCSIVKKTIKIYGDGFQVRDALYADDLVDAYIKASKCIKTNGQVYNLGGGYKHKISVIGLINILENKFNMKIKCKVLKERKGDQKYLYQIIQKQKKILAGNQIQV